MIAPWLRQRGESSGCIDCAVYERRLADARRDAFTSESSGTQEKKRPSLLASCLFPALHPLGVIELMEIDAIRTRCRLQAPETVCERM